MLPSLSRFRLAPFAQQAMSTLSWHPSLIRALPTVGALFFVASGVAGDNVRRYGAGTPGSGNVVPTVWVNTTPRPGDVNFSLRVERTLGGTWAIPLVSTAPANINFGGVRLLVDPARASQAGAFFLPGQGNGGGSGDIPMPIANNPGLIGVTTYVQVFTLDDFAPNPAGFGASTGLALTVAMSAQLLVSRAVSGSPDPQTAIDLPMNAVVDYDRSLFDDCSGVILAGGGTAALQLDPVTSRLRAFDTTTFPPVWRSNTALSTEGHPDQIVATPDGTRAYVLYTAALGTSPPIVAHDARIGSSFGQLWPGSPIRLEQIADPRGMVFTPDSRTAFVASLAGLNGAGGSVRRIDVQPGSGLFHQETGQIEFSGYLAADVAIAADGSTLYVPLVNASGLSELAVVDVATFVARDMDLGAPGVQNLGGELSRPRTALPSLLAKTVVDPRGEEVYCATVGGVVRVNVASESPLFRRVTMLNASIAPNQFVTVLALTDAADRLYAATNWKIVEFDTRVGTALRMWGISGTTGLALR